MVSGGVSSDLVVMLPLTSEETEPLTSALMEPLISAWMVSGKVVLTVMSEVLTFKPFFCWSAY